ncbi:MAG: hypothetical protein GYB36_11090 [Alphaproteobacteria bacterium]|nr:hypothetical protein [Alphaproteobacteria bacterium]
MRLLLSVILSVFLASPAFAGGGGGGGGDSYGGSGGGAANRIITLFNLSGGEEEVEEESSDDPRSFTMPAVVAPLSNEYGRLTGFAYVLLRVRVAPGHDVWSVQEDAHYALDAMVRVAHRINLSVPSGETLDTEVASEVWQAVIRDMHGDDAIEYLEIRDFDVRLFQN